MTLNTVSARTGFSAVLLAWTLLASAAEAQYVVNSTVDEVDLVPGDGQCLTGSGVCTLRAAVQESNVALSLNVVTLPAGVFRLTIGGANEDSAASGDLDVTDDLIIEGVRSVSSIIDANGLDRVFDQRAGVLQLKRVTVRNGRADHGGGIRSAVPTLVLEDSVVRDNVATGTGGGVWLSYPGQIVRSTVAMNRAGTQGGGIYAGVAVPNGVHDISNSTISNNHAGASGGGIVIATSASGGGAVIVHATIHLNAASAGNSLFIDAGAAAALRNSLVTAVANNCAGSGAIVHEGGSLAGSSCGSVPVSPTIFGSLESLGLYHPPLTPGPALGHGLAGNSPAIGAASPAFCLPVDQRAIPRPEGGSCDSGAFEFHPVNGPYNATPVTLRLSPATDQTIRTGTSTPPLRIVASDGSAPIEQLVLSGGTSNPVIVSPAGIRITREADGVWNVRAIPNPNATGLVLIELRAVSFAPDDMATTSFALTVVGADGLGGGGTPTAAVGPPPSGLAATPSGAGAVLTWQGSAAPGVRHYAVTGGRSTGGTSLPVLLTAGTETSTTLPSLPDGPYFFRVHAIGTHGVTDNSNEAAAVLGSANAAGPPFGVIGTALPGAVEVTGRAPVFGAPPSAYRVEIGTTIGASDVASVMPTSAPFQHPLAPGFYWLQARAISGALLGVPSSTFGIRIGGLGAPCNEAPHAPFLLPPSTTGTTATLTWLMSTTGAPSLTYALERLSGPVGPVLETIDLTTQATVYVADLTAGTHFFRVAGQNACGTGQLSNVIAVSIP